MMRTNSTFHNRLLSLLDESASKKLLPLLRTVNLERDQVLARESGKVELVYFAHTAVISGFVSLRSGSSVEALTIGRDGAFGVGQALDHRIAINDSVVTVAGQASVIEPAELERLAIQDTDFRKTLLAYDQFMLAHVQQNAVCNASHSVKQRYAKHLLRLHDLTGEPFYLPQQIASQYMGVRRTTITNVATEFLNAGAIKVKRGLISVVRPDDLEHFSCECHDRIATLYDRLVVHPAS